MYHRLLVILKYGNLDAESGDLGGQQILAWICFIVWLANSMFSNYGQVIQ